MNEPIEFIATLDYPSQLDAPSVLLVLDSIAEEDRIYDALDSDTRYRVIITPITEGNAK